MIELGADVHARDGDGRTPLHNAVQFCICDKRGAVKLTGRLLEAGVDAKAADEEGVTPLHVVTYPECVDVLVAAGADLEARNREGFTPIYTIATECPLDSFDGINFTSKVVLRMADLGADLVNTGGRRGFVARKVEELRAQRS